ncbi:MAG TPA: NHL repeat-containing protein, partial [Longimicrobium sp.]
GAHFLLDGAMLKAWRGRVEGALRSDDPGGDIPAATPAATPAAPAPERPSPMDRLRGRGGFAQEVLRFGSEGTGAGRFEDARSVAVDGAGRIYVAEYIGGRVQVFDSAGTFVTQWMADPRMPLLDLAADRDGTVYVVQSGRIHRYEGATGRALEPLPSRQVRYEDVAVALDGSLWTVANNDAVHLSRDGAVLQTIDLEEAVDEDADPARIAVSGTGDVYVLDQWKADVYHLNRDGRFVDRFGGGGFPGAEDVVVDGAGRVFVSRMGDASVQVFSAAGQPVGRIEGISIVFGMAITDRDELFVAARNENQVVKFRVPAAERG